MGVNPPGLGKPSSPTQLTAVHNIDGFDCGIESLNFWLKRHGAASMRSISRSAQVYVSPLGEIVTGYYTLSTSAVSRDEVTTKIGRNASDPVPVILLGRLAVDKGFQGQGIGAGLLKDALFRCLKAAEVVGLKAVVVQALNDNATAFYENFEFRRSPVRPNLLMISIDQIRHNL